MSKIGVLHPGQMGISVAASAINSGHHVYWTSADRSDMTRRRAEKHHLIEIETLPELCQSTEIIFSVCPPHAAEGLAKSVLETGFKGFYLEANAISPQRSIRIGQMLEENGIHFIDGGIIGGPAWTPNETWLYLSGKDADWIAECFTKGPLETKVIGSEIGKASALKMCYAAYSKGTTALLSAILATAESLKCVTNCINNGAGMKGFSDQVIAESHGVTAKAWRFEEK
jgi:3-hydroxyisobutyrate dehydrogenase-like beta-hydroxyacid dehydrogenase